MAYFSIFNNTDYILSDPLLFPQDCHKSESLSDLKSVYRS